MAFLTIRALDFFFLILIMQKIISIVTSGHPYYDERIFYKFARSLNKNGYEVSIICSTVETEIDLVKDNIHIIGFNGSNLKKTEKVKKFFDHLKKTEPNIVICCEPLPILAASKLRKSKTNVKIIYDVTEWYPENVAFKHYGLRKLVSYFILFIFNIYASNLADAIIIGELGKKRRYDVIAPAKRKQIISYYPVLEYFKFSPIEFDGKNLRLCYAGLLKFDRGIKTIYEAIKKLSTKYPKIRFIYKLIGKFESAVEAQEFNSLIEKDDTITVELYAWTEYPNISNLLADVNVCLDLRTKNFIYNNSLPIKIFEYMACGKPFIFTNVKPICSQFDFSTCGFVVNPDSLDAVVNAISKYIDNKELISIHANNSRKLIETKYNWEKESEKLLELINSLG